MEDITNRLHQMHRDLEDHPFDIGVQLYNASWDCTVEAAQHIDWQRGELNRLRAELRATSDYANSYLAVLRDLAEHGLRVDLSPTVLNGGDYLWWSNYLRRADRLLRDRAIKAIAPRKESDDHDP